MRVKHRPGWYALRAGMASVLALGTAGLVAASSAAASPAASGGPHCNASVTRNNFGTANSGPYVGNQTVWRYTITNRHCMQVRIITYGAEPMPQPTVRSISRRLRENCGFMALMKALWSITSFLPLAA